LEEHCPYFHTEYLDFVENLKLDPESQVQVTFKPQADRESSPEGTPRELTSGDGRDAKRRKVQDANESSTEEMGLIEMDIQGPWRDCILYEVPLMSICEFPRLSCTTNTDASR
jgi:nicotinate phosphoribosyltransferase